MKEYPRVVRFLWVGLGFMNEPSECRVASEVKE